MTTQARCESTACQPVSGQTRPFPSMPLEALLDADPDASLWERLYWQFTLPPFLSMALNGLGEKMAVDNHEEETVMTNECKPLVEVSIQRYGRRIPLGIMNVAQALELPHHRDYLFVHLAGKADDSPGGLPQSR